MLNTLLLTLKIIGIVLLCIVCILLLLVMLVMFVPVRYKGKASRDKGEEDPLYALAGVSWLLHILRADYEYKEGKGSLSIRVFGIRIRSGEERRESKRLKEERRRKKNERKRALEERKYTETAGEKKHGSKKKNKDDEPEYTIYEYNKEGTEVRTERGGKNGKTTVYVEEHEEGLDIEYPSMNNDPTDKKDDTPHNDNIDEDDPAKDKDDRSVSEKLKRLAEKAEQFAGKIGIAYEKLSKGLERLVKKAGDTLSNIDYYHTALCNDSKNREVLRLLTAKLKRLIKAIRPRKVKGHLDCGFDDPSSTGMVLAGAAVLYPLYGRSIKIEPDFRNEVLAFDLSLKGRIYICVVVKILLQLYFNRKVKRFIRIMKKENSIDG